MEITNEERREVAGRIRERIWRNRRTAWDVVLVSSCVDVFGYRFRSNEEFALFLTDLIDCPKCHDAEDERNKAFTCSACGFSDSKLIFNPFGIDLIELKPDFHYCPNCGAEVVE